MRKTSLSALAVTLLAGSALPVLAAPKVVTGTPVIQSLAALVVGDTGPLPDVMLGRGSDPHHYQMRPSDVRTLSQADLLIWLGPQMTPWLESAKDGSAPDVAQLQLLSLPETHKEFFAEGEGEEEGGDEGAGHHDHDAHEHGHDHEEGGINPHAWLDPENAQIWLHSIADKLSEIDPDNAAAYAANADAAAARLKKMDAEIAEKLLPLSDKGFVTGHDAFGYLTHAYNLRAGIPLADGDASAPGAARLAEARKELTDHHVICAFPDAEHDPKQVAQLIEGTDVKMGRALDPAGLEQDHGPDLYEHTLRAIADTLSDCMSN